MGGPEDGMDTPGAAGPCSDWRQDIAPLDGEERCLLVLPGAPQGRATPLGVLAVIGGMGLAFLAFGLVVLGRAVGAGIAAGLAAAFLGASPAGGGGDLAPLGAAFAVGGAGFLAFGIAYARTGLRRRRRVAEGRVRYGLWVTDRRVVLKDAPLLRDRVRWVARDRILHHEVSVNRGIPSLRLRDPAGTLVLEPRTLAGVRDGEDLWRRIQAVGLPP